MATAASGMESLPSWQVIGLRRTSPSPRPASWPDAFEIDQHCPAQTHFLLRMHLLCQYFLIRFRQVTDGGFHFLTASVCVGVRWAAELRRSGPTARCARPIAPSSQGCCAPESPQSYPSSDHSPRSPACMHSSFRAPCRRRSLSQVVAAIMATGCRPPLAKSVAVEDDLRVCEHLFDEMRTNQCGSSRADVVARIAAAWQAGGRVFSLGARVCSSSLSDGRVGAVIVGDRPHVSARVRCGRGRAGGARVVGARVLSRVRRSPLHV